jgi:hypothetical protein
MIKVISIIMLMIIPTTVVGSELPQIAPLSEGDEAPYSGVLYNAAAVAETIAQREALVAQHSLNLEILEERLRAELGLTIDNLQTDLDAANKKYDSMLSIKNGQIESLQELALERDNTTWWFLGGIGTGLLITIGASYALK